MDLWIQKENGELALQPSKNRTAAPQLNQPKRQQGAALWKQKCERIDGAAKHVSIPELLTTLHATRAQVFAIVGSEDLFLLLQKDPVLEPKQRILPVAGMCAMPHLTPKERERQRYSLLQPEGQVLIFSQHPTPLLFSGKKNLCIFPLKDLSWHWSFQRQCCQRRWKNKQVGHQS